MLKPGGLFIFSCATTGRPEHGTRRTTPHDAPLTHDFGEWGDYYKNLEECDVRAVIDIDSAFGEYCFSTQHKTHDLYFWGIKNGKLNSRKDYSFLNNDNPYKIKLTESNVAISRIASEKVLLENSIRKLSSEMEAMNTEIANIKKSASWHITKPIRFLGRLTRGEFNQAFDFFTKPKFFKKVDGFLGKIIKASSYALRGDFAGLIERIKYSRLDNRFNSLKNSDVQISNLNFGILTPGHTIFVAKLIAERLRFHGCNVEILTSSSKFFPHDFYIVICPQVFNKLPPGEKRISFQMEQSVSSRWFTEKYNNILDSSFAIFEYSLINLEYLEKRKITYPHVHYLPIGATENYGKHVSANEKKYDVTFYGDSRSSQRRTSMLEALKEIFNVHVIDDLFGDDVISELKKSKVIVNIHYYENALLEMPRIQECLSLGLVVASESSQDQKDYPELEGAVIFFEEGSISGMIDAVRLALDTPPLAIEKSVSKSRVKFEFMFDRFLISMGLLPSSHVNIMSLPLPNNRNMFGLSMPETITRRKLFQDVKPKECITFDGIRRTPGWVGCGLSYAALARHSKVNNITSMTVMEDDVVLPTDFDSKFNSINNFLTLNHGRWDVFSGVIAALNSNTKVVAVEDFEGQRFVTIDKMTSTVFNIYAESAIEMLACWNPEDLDAEKNTIDRYLENQKTIKVITTLPFLVGHREEAHSTLWGFQNTTYVEMIANSQALLELKVTEFLSNDRLSPLQTE
jgi:hypothetical protein